MIASGLLQSCSINHASRLTRRLECGRRPVNRVCVPLQTLRLFRQSQLAAGDSSKIETSPLATTQPIARRRASLPLVVPQSCLEAPLDTQLSNVFT